MITLFKQNRIRKYYYLFFLPFYLIFGLLRVCKILPKKYILFGAGGGSQFIDNSKYAYLMNKDRNNCIWITHSYRLSKELKNNGFRSYLSFGIPGIYFQLFSQLAVVSHGTFDLIPIFLFKVPVLQYWHGCPIKKIGLDIEDKKNEKSLGDIIWIGIYKICPHLNNYYSDYLVDHSKSMNYQASFKFSNPSYIKIPYPRLIPLYHEQLQFEEPNEQLTELTRQKSNGKKIIVYMPTYRDGLDGQLKLEEQLINLSNIFSKDDRFIFVYKSHFVINKGIADNNIVIYSNRDPYPLLKLSCGLITDYSSIVFDYLPSKKPITMFVFDKDIYKRMPGYYYDIENNFSSIISYDYMETFEKIKNEVFSDKNYDTEKGMIFNNLFSNTFYKGGTFNISIIKQKFIDGHA